MILALILDLWLRWILQERQLTQRVALVESVPVQIIGCVDTSLGPIIQNPCVPK